MDNPLAIVKERFGDKAKLVAEVEKLAGEDLWVARTSKDKGLAHVSNAKLLRLHRIFTQVKEEFGTRDKLIDAILEIEKRTKDEGYKSRLAKFPVPRLYDMIRTARKRSGVPAAKTEAPKAAAKKPRAKKAEAAPAEEKEVEKPAKKPAAKRAARAKSEK